MSTAWPTSVDMTTCTNDGTHNAHTWRGKQCAGRSAAESITLGHIELVANALGLDPGRMMISVLGSIKEAQR